MHPPPATAALRRLGATALLLALGWSLACRPAWSPDGEQVAFTANIDDQFAVATYRLGDERASLVRDLPADAKSPCNAAWLEDGDLLVIRVPKVDGYTLQWRRIAPDGSLRSTQEALLPVRPGQIGAVPPVIVDGALFLGDEQIVRVDLDSGEVRTAPRTGVPDDAPDDAKVVVCRAGDGLCYMQQLAEDGWKTWELGRLDPETLARTPVIRTPEGSTWKVLPTPSFDRSGARVALPAQRDGGAAILVFQDGQPLHTLEVRGEEALPGPVTWAPDGVTLVAMVLETLEEPHRRRASLLETDFAGNLERRTELLEFPHEGTTDSQADALLLQPSLSPDGRHAAITTAYVQGLPRDEHGLLLVDRGSPERTVQRVVFPQRPDGADKVGK